MMSSRYGCGSCASAGRHCVGNWQAPSHYCACSIRRRAMATLARAVSRVRPRSAAASSGSCTGAGARLRLAGTRVQQDSMLECCFEPASRTAVLVVPSRHELTRTREGDDSQQPHGPARTARPPTAGRIHEQARNRPHARVLNSCLHVGCTRVPGARIRHSCSSYVRSPSPGCAGARQSRPDVPASPGGAAASRGPWQQMRPVGPALSRNRPERTGTRTAERPGGQRCGP